MAPSATTIPVDSHVPPKDENATKSRNTAPLKKSGSLDAAFTFDDVTPTIGREYLTARIVEDILHAPNSDDLLRDLAITSKLFPFPLCHKKQLLNKHQSQRTRRRFLPKTRLFNQRPPKRIHLTPRRVDRTSYKLDRAYPSYPQSYT
jgi:hypothetical protein